MKSKPSVAGRLLSPTDEFFLIHYSIQMANHLCKSRSRHFRHIAKQWLTQFQKRSELLFKNSPPEEYRVWEALVDLLDNEEYHPIPFSKVAQKTGLKKPNIIRAINKLVIKGFIEKQPDTSKKRYRNYRLLEM